MAIKMRAETSFPSASSVTVESKVSSEESFGVVVMIDGVGENDCVTDGERRSGSGGLVDIWSSASAQCCRYECRYL